MEEIDPHLMQILEHHKRHAAPNDQQALLFLLREVQELEGWLSDTTLAVISKTLSIPASLLNALIRRAPSLRSSPYRHEIVLCTGPRCASKNAAALLSYLEKTLHLQPGEATSDRRFFLRTQNCLKHCATSPNLRIDGTLYRNVTVIELEKMLREYP